MQGEIKCAVILGFSIGIEATCMHLGIKRCREHDQNCRCPCWVCSITITHILFLVAHFFLSYNDYGLPRYEGWILLELQEK